MILANPFTVDFSSGLLIEHIWLLLTIFIEIFVFGRLLWTTGIKAMRPAFVFALLIFLLYGIPSLIFAFQIRTGLIDSTLFFCAIHFSILALLGWAWATHRFFLKSECCTVHTTGFSIPVLLFLLPILPAIYFLKVPFDCTAIYALMFDPRMSLLAREFGIKLIGSTAATYAFGAIANTLVPTIVAFAIVRLSNARTKKIPVLEYFAWLIAVVVGLALVLVGGVKGLLMPTLITSSVVAFYVFEKWWLKVIGAVLPICFLVLFLIGFLMAIERGSQVGNKYDFASCTVRLGVCTQSKELVNSLLGRNWSLGLPIALSQKVAERLDCYCDQNILSKDQCVKAELLVSNSLNAGGEATAVGRASDLTSAVFRRAFIVPIQVASWHFGYGEREGAPGWRAMPIVRRFVTDPVNVPERAYQTFGSIYSGGDRTSTSTAPTGFFLAYPAYIGWLGVLLSILLILFLDLCLSKLLTGVDATRRGIAMGLVWVVGLNLMVSDFVTVFTSHGGLLALILVSIFNYECRTTRANKV